MTDACGIDVDHIEFIPGGRTNESFAVFSADGKKYLARIAGDGTEAYVDRKRERHNLIASNRAGVSPKLLLMDGANLLMEYIDGVCTTDCGVLFMNGNVDKLTAELRKLHGSGERFEGSFSFIRDHHLYKDDFLRTGHPIPEEIRREEERLYRMTQWVDDTYGGNPHPVHSDAAIQNFIFTDERAYILDWEYSTAADPYLDLASFCTQNILAPGQEELFLRSYFSGAEEEFDEGKFLLFKMAISFMWLYWHFNNFARGKDPYYNEYRWRMHLNNAVVCLEEWERRFG